MQDEGVQRWQKRKPRSDERRLGLDRLGEACPRKRCARISRRRTLRWQKISRSAVDWKTALREPATLARFQFEPQKSGGNSGGRSRSSANNLQSVQWLSSRRALRFRAFSPCPPNWRPRTRLLESTATTVASA